jgi:hypothetical protein
MDWKGWIGKDELTVERLERDDRKGRTEKGLFRRMP